MTIAEKLLDSSPNRYRAPNPASLTRLSTNIMLAIHVSLVPFSLALMWFVTCFGLSELAFDWIPFSQT
jgi:hypothetical protein